MGVSFDLFGTLVATERSGAPAAAVARELTARDVSVPADWSEAYTEAHFEWTDGAECSLVDHVTAALESRDCGGPPGVIAEAVLAAFTAPVETREGAHAAIAAASERGPVAVCSNCSVPGLVELTLERSTISTSVFDAVVTSVDCGWRKPSPAIFEETAVALGCSLTNLVHIGDDPRTDRGIVDCGGRFYSPESMTAVPDWLEANG